MGAVLHNQANLRRRQSQPSEALRLLDEAIARQQQALEARSRHVQSRRFLAKHTVTLGELECDAEYWNKVETHFTQALDALHELRNELPSITEFIDAAIGVEG